MVYEFVERFAPIVANKKKSHFRPSDEKSMKSVDKDAVNTTMGIIVI